MAQQIQQQANQPKILLTDIKEIQTSEIGFGWICSSVIYLMLLKCNGMRNVGV